MATLWSLKSNIQILLKRDHVGSATFERALPLIKYIPETSVVDLNGVLQEVRRSLTNELDF